MATLDETIRIIIAADDLASDVLRGAADNLQGFSDRVEKLAAPLADVASVILKTQAAVSALAVVFAGVAIKEASDFEDSMYLVKKQLDDSGPSIDVAKERIEGLATAYGNNANDVAQSAAGFLAAGYSYETAMRLVETSTRFMIAGDLDALKATDYLNASLAGFKVPAADAASAAEHVGDILNKIADISTSRALDPIADAFSKVAPTAKTAGLSMEETAAIVARLIDVFQDGGIAGTALNSGLLHLADPAKEAQEKLDTLGVSTRTASGELRQSGDVLKDLAGKWGTLSDAQQTEASTVIFGKEQAAKMQVVLGDWAKIQDYLNQLMDKTTGAVGSMGREVQAKLGLISTQARITGEDWRQMLTHFGEQLVSGDGFENLVKNVGLLGTSIKSVIDTGGFDPIIKYAKDQFEGLSDTVAAVAKNLPAAFEGVDWSGLVSSLDALGAKASGIFKDLFGDVDITTVEGLRTAIQNTIDTLSALSYTTAGIVESFRPVAQAIRETVVHFNELSDADKIDFGETIGSAKVLIDVGVGLGAALIAIGKAGLDMGSVLDAVFGGVKVAVNSLQVAFDTAILGILELFQAMPESIKNYLGTSTKEVDELIDGVKENALRNSQELKDGWAQATGGASESTDKLRARLDDARGSLDKVRESASRAGDGVAHLSAAAQSADDALDFRSASKAADAIDSLAKGFSDLSLGIPASTAALALLNVATDESGNAITKTKLVTGQYVNVLRDGEGNIVGYSQAVGEATKKVDEHAKKADEATKKTESFQLEMEKLASNERIKTIEFAVGLKTAQMETDMERVKATFASLDNTIDSTGTLLGSLFDNLVSATSLRDKFDISSQIAKEDERRERALKLQEQLAAAEIARVEAQTVALNRGDALIQIDGSGLAPQLEAFMWEVLKAIRVRANADFQDFLLGAT